MPSQSESLHVGAESRCRDRLLGQPQGPVETLDAAEHRNLELGSPDWASACGWPARSGSSFCMTTPTTVQRSNTHPVQTPSRQRTLGLRTPTPNFSCSTPSPSSAASPSPSANSDSREAACSPFRPLTVPSPTCMPTPVVSPSRFAPRVANWPICCWFETQLVNVLIGSGLARASTTPQKGPVLRLFRALDNDPPCLSFPDAMVGDPAGEDTLGLDRV